MKAGVIAPSPATAILRPLFMVILRMPPRLADLTKSSGRAICASAGANVREREQRALQRFLVERDVAGDRVRLAKSNVQSTRKVTGCTEACTAGTCGRALQRAR